jgi:hypothetical protein
MTNSVIEFNDGSGSLLPRRRIALIRGLSRATLFFDGLAPRYRRPSFGK